MVNLKMFELQKSIRTEVSKNRIVTAIFLLKELSKLNNSKYQNHILMLDSRFHQYREIKIKNTEKEESISIELNRIKLGILEIVDLILNEGELIFDPKYRKLSIVKMKCYNESDKIIIILIRRFTNEKFQIDVNPFFIAKTIAKQIFNAFEPNFEDSFFFKQERVKIILSKKNDHDIFIPLNMDLSLNSNGVKNMDIISLDFEFTNILSSICIDGFA